MILIADDDAGLAESCSMLLEACGYDVQVVPNGAEALSSIAAREPKLLISDYCMPGMSGLQLCETLKARPSGRAFPILLMSGTLQARVALGSYDAFLRKPFLAEEFLLKVRRLLKNGPLVQLAAAAPSTAAGM